MLKAHVTTNFVQNKKLMRGEVTLKFDPLTTGPRQLVRKAKQKIGILRTHGTGTWCGYEYQWRAIGGMYDMNIEIIGDAAEKEKLFSQAHITRYK